MNRALPWLCRTTFVVACVALAACRSGGDTDTVQPTDADSVHANVIQNAQQIALDCVDDLSRAPAPALSDMPAFAEPERAGTEPATGTM
jgi:hypothetical protein